MKVSVKKFQGFMDLREFYNLLSHGRSQGRYCSLLFLLSHNTFTKLWLNKELAETRNSVEKPNCFNIKVSEIKRQGMLVLERIIVAHCVIYFFVVWSTTYQLNSILYESWQFFLFKCPDVASVVVRPWPHQERRWTTLPTFQTLHLSPTHPADIVVTQIKATLLGTH